MYLEDRLEDEDQDEPDQKIGICEECGNVGVMRSVEDRVLCEACADLIEDLPEEESS